jgi:hypothetical protein
MVEESSGSFEAGQEVELWLMTNERGVGTSGINARGEPGKANRAAGAIAHRIRYSTWTD